MIATNRQPSLWLAPGVYMAKLTEQKLITSFCNITEISLEELRSKSRKKEVRQARQILMRLIKFNFPELSLKKIGYIFKHDHATVLHSIRVIQNMIETDKEFKNYYHGIANRIGNMNMLHKPLLR